MIIAGVKAAEQRAGIAHSGSYGLQCPNFHQAPVGAKENHHLNTHFFRPIRGLNHFANMFPRLSPWAIIARHSVAYADKPLKDLRVIYGSHFYPFADAYHF
jgi:hypothetical protein